MTLPEVTRDQLVAICERAVVPVDKWRNRDTPGAQERPGTAWALLKAGCDWRIAEEMYTPRRPTEPETTIWIRITYPGFSTFDWDGPAEDELFYLPTETSLERANGEDWY